MHISRQFMYFTGKYMYIHIYIWHSFILHLNISISSQFMHIAGEYVYIYTQNVYMD